MSEDDSDSSESSGDESLSGVQTDRSTIIGSETVEHSETVEKSGDVTESDSPPEDGYVMAPTDNDPDRGDSSDSDSSE